MSRAREPGRLNLLYFASLCCFGLRGMNDVCSAVMRTGAVEGERGEEGRERKGRGRCPRGLWRVVCVRGGDSLSRPRLRRDNIHGILASADHETRSPDQ